MNNGNNLYVALYGDAHIARRVIRRLQREGYDAISAHDVGNSDLDDPGQLEYAASQRRAIVTFNERDFNPLYNQWWEQGRTHYGIIVSNEIPMGELRRRLLKLLDTITADEMVNNIKHLGEFAEHDE
jgi:predicted nuclease of predicted toxin-antitoxin system